jgi:Protein of unknown function (DUF4089)
MVRKGKTKKKTLRTAKTSTSGRRAKALVRAKSKPPRHDAVDALITASAEALKLPIDPAWHAGVKLNLQLILRLGALVDEFPLPDNTEPAPVFRA